MNRNEKNPYQTRQVSGLLGFLFFMAFLLLANISFAQDKVSAIADTTQIKIGEQIKYQIQVDTKPENLVVFPEGDSLFAPMELVESKEADTIQNKTGYRLLKEYFLTKFDSGHYVIPRQKVLIGNNSFTTDSIPVEVNTVAVDTTKQKLYPIKPSIEVPPPFTVPDWVWWLLGILFLAGLVAFFIIRRKKKAAEEPELPPYEQAMVELDRLDHSDLLEKREIKEYYSQLSFSARKYLDRKIYDRGLESTTNELIAYLEKERQEGHLNLTENTIRDFRKILDRADLAKFARSKPDVITAKEDRSKTQHIIDDLKASVPEPTEEELMQDEAYIKEQARRKKRRRIVFGIIAGAVVIIIGISALIATKGFDYVKDTYIGHPTKELLEGDWIRSEYGNPPVAVTTPKVLIRTDLPLTEDEKQMMPGLESFAYGSLLSNFYTVVNTVKFKGEVKFDLEKALDGIYAELEKQGAQNIVMKHEDFTTVNGAKGMKVFGTLDAKNPVTGKTIPNEYVILNFAVKGGFEQVIVVYNEDDKYADEIAGRIINSVELLNLEE
ncbi:DUF4381 domain-containing protein [Christiangramia fulva]|uniref:DUF4381 domain-containing protein n=1 Tax=Christiangramia fulva TaxID=2126553 RepID=A0A2R3Z335_9FLAO|nr:DUF4381 domain-containing protein [Christiangramia fulva]AVR44675.1 DUF4381 domain-containing protein [Christiangramia fulva]